MYHLERTIPLSFPFADTGRALAEAMEMLGYVPAGENAYTRGRRRAGWRTIDPREMYTALRVRLDGDVLRVSMDVDTSGSVRTGYFYGWLYAEFVALACFLATGQWDDRALRRHMRRRGVAGVIFLVLGIVMFALFGVSVVLFEMQPFALMASMATLWISMGGIAIGLMPLVFPHGRRQCESGRLVGSDGLAPAESYA